MLAMTDFLPLFQVVRDRRGRVDPEEQAARVAAHEARVARDLAARARELAQLRRGRAHAPLLVADAVAALEVVGHGRVRQLLREQTLTSGELGDVTVAAFARALVRAGVQVNERQHAWLEGQAEQRRTA